MTPRSRSLGRRWYRESWKSAGVATLVAVVGGLLIGGLTSPAQQYLPSWATSFSNSAGGWTMFAFLLVWLGRARPLLAAFLGVIAFELLNEGYGLVSLWRGHFYSALFSNIWSVIGLIAGPVLGVAASFTRWGSALWRVLGVAVLSAVLLGEGIHSLLTVVSTTGPVYWVIEIVLSVVFLVIAIAVARPRAAHALLAVAVWLVGTAAFIAFIQLLLR